MFALVWMAYLPGNMGCSDSMWSVPTAVSLVDDRDPNLDEHYPILRARGFVFTQRVNGHWYTIYPLGTSIVAAPAVIVLRPIAAAVRRHAPSIWARLEAVQVERGCPPVESEPIIALHSWTEHLIASAIVAATAVVVFFIAAREVSAGSAVVVALLFAFGTSAWSTASRSLWQHGPSMFLLGLALLVQLRVAGSEVAPGSGGHRPGVRPPSDARRALFWVGVLLAFACVVRPTNVIPLAAAAGWTLLSRPRDLPAFLVGAGVVLLLFVWSNIRIYGAWLPPYYRPGFYSRNFFIGDALAGNLMSPARGLFVFSPIFLLSVVGVVMLAASRRLTLLDLSVAGSVFVHWIAVAVSNGNWWGGDSYGPRFFADLLPYLMFLCLPVFRWIESARGAGYGIAAAGVGVLGAFSVAVHAQGALNRATSDWNLYPTSVSLDPVRVWDWRHPQFLAGITFTPAPLPPIDLGILACSAPPGMPGTPFVVENNRGTVALQWEPASGPVAVYIMDVGSGPGLNDEPPREARDVLRPTVIARRVPPGTYYVRVRGRNRCGDGPSSPEVAVTVR
jgi:hypothetical protein